MDPWTIKRSCGHPYLANYAVPDPQTGVVRVYCFPCLVEKVGLKPCEILTPEEFQKRYAGSR